MKLAKVYRTGPVTTPVCDFDEYAQILTAADAVRPAGHLARAQTIFASATIVGNSRWLHALTIGLSHGGDKVMNEIAVDPTGIFVYSVNAWEDATWGNGERGYKNSKRAYRDYWATAIPLADFARVAMERGLDAKEWEVALPAEAVRTIKPVSLARLKSALDPQHHDTESLLERYKRIMKHYKWDQVRQASQAA